MDPVTLYKLGLIRQQELLERAAQDQGALPMRHYLSEIGALLVRVGQKLVDAANPALPAQSIAPQPSVENC